MREELDKKLCEKYPLLFKNRYGNPQETLMCFGLECGDGWYNIIDVLCVMLYGEYRWTKERYDYLVEAGVGGVWYGKKLVTQFDIDTAKTRMDEEAAKVPVVSQIKEKFGTLRFYVDRATDKHHNYIAMAEAMSARTCEVCGNPGHIRGKGWLYTACDEHTREEDLVE